MIKPLSNQVLIEQVKEEDKISGGIVLPETAEKEESKKAKVISLGKITDEKGNEIKAEVKAGDIIIHDAFGHDIKEGDKEYQIISYKDILAIIK